MYKLVESVEEEAIFNQIWTQVWAEKGFELEFTENPLGQCLVYDECQVPVATVEMKFYQPHASELDKLAPFASHPCILNAPDRVAEVDKVAIPKQFRGKNLDRLLATIVLFAERNQIENYVTLLEPLLYRALKISYHVPLTRLGERIFYKGEDVIPTIIHASEFYQHKERYDWFMKATEPKLNEPATFTS